jgi:hypothetical protein
LNSAYATKSGKHYGAEQSRHTLFDAVFLGTMMLAVGGASHALDALVEVVLGWRALLGLSAL